MSIPRNPVGPPSHVEGPPPWTAAQPGQVPYGSQPVGAQVGDPYAQQKETPGGMQPPTPASVPSPYAAPSAGPQVQQMMASQPMVYSMQGPVATAMYAQQGTVLIRNLAEFPDIVVCPSCGQRGMTNVSYKVGSITHIWAAVAFCFTICLVFVPYLVNSMKDAEHRCSYCGARLATWHRSGGTTEVHLHV